MNLFSSQAQFKDTFDNQLAHKLQDHARPNQLVMITANAITTDYKPLLKRLQPLVSEYKDISPEKAEEDELVLRQLAAYQMDEANAALVHNRTLSEGWHLQFNKLRSFRPRRSAGEPITTIHQDFNPEKFNFNKVREEVIEQGKLLGRNVSTFYNKYPIEPYHILIVPEPEAGHPQLLSREHHEFACELVAGSHEKIPGLIIGYNSLGRFASVNHFHFQAIVTDRELTLDRMHSEGHEYPIPYISFDSPAASWDFIAGLHERNNAYNVVYRPNFIAVFPRRFQGTYPQPDWTTGFAWYELAGNFLVKDETSYKKLTNHDIHAAYQALIP